MIEVQQFVTMHCMNGDLHVHSDHSDGALSVEAVLLTAKERGLSCVSVADLNTTEATEEAVEIGTRIGVTVVPGVEIAAVHLPSEREVHILGYAFALPAVHIDALCAAARTDRSAPPGARVVIDAIHRDGGRAVLAHPGQTDSYSLVDDLVGVGLDGIELYHPDHGPADHRFVQEIAARHGLITTGGSDSGGRSGAAVEIGDLRAPFGTFERLLAPHDELIAWTEALVREAGAMARRAVLSEIDAELKGGNIRNIVTEHDKAIERFLTDAIRSRFPDHGFVTEEYEHPPVVADTPTWIIDPIDGTTNFVSIHRYFAVSLAFYRGLEPVFGFVYDVMADELYVGIAGGGAFLNGRPLHARVKSAQDSIVETSLTCARRLEERYGADTTPLVRDVRAQRAYGSASLGICRIAAGSLDVYISCSLSLWDYAAAIIVLSEAGGRIAVERRRRSAATASGTHAPLLTRIGQSIIYNDDKHLFMAAGSEGALREITGMLFVGPRPPELALLAPSGVVG